MGIFRSTDPTVWDDVDGIIINESAPASNIAGVAANVGILVGVTQRGLPGLTEIGSIGEFIEVFGKDDTKGVNIALKNKKFGSLKIIRVTAAAAVTATKAFVATATPIITFTAKQGSGVYGNGIKVTIEAGSTTGKKYTIQDTNTDAVLPIEIYDNIVIASVTSSTFADSKLVTAVVNATSSEPDNCAATALASGASGSVADTDYQTAIAYAAVENAGNFIFCDSYNDTISGYLKTHVAATMDKIAIVAGSEGLSVADTITDVADFRDTDGRIIYAYPWLQTTINGISTYVSPAPWLASILTQTAPNIDPAYTKNSQYCAGVTGLKTSLTRANYVSLMAAGVCSFERTSVGNYKPRSGVCTQISDTSKRMIFRRRMADFLTVSVAEYLNNYQNAVNSKENRTAVKGAILAFVDSLERDGILPKDSDVTSGVAKLVDTESLNTDNSIALGYFKILWKQRIYSSMRFIVLQAEIGESVVVTEQE